MAIASSWPGSQSRIILCFIQYAFITARHQCLIRVSEFDSSGCPGQEVSVSLSGHLCTIGNGSTNVFLCQLRIFYKNLVSMHAVRQKIKNQRYPYTGTTDTRFSKAHIWVNGNALQKWIHLFPLFHLYSQNCCCT